MYQHDLISMINVIAAFVIGWIIGGSMMYAHLRKEIKVARECVKGVGEKADELTKWHEDKVRLLNELQRLHEERVLTCKAETKAWERAFRRAEASYDALKAAESERLHKAVVAGLQQCITAHGPVTSDLTGSAAKRIKATYVNMIENVGKVAVGQGGI